MTSTNKRVNVLVFSGDGASLSSVRHATWSLRRLLGPNYAVITVTGDQILNEPWAASCALLVMPGGADLGYCRKLNGEGNRRIRQYVLLGGKYLGLCAGGYYGSNKCEFEVGKRGMEVIGDRELAFFPGTCRGLAFPGFVYASEAGARAVELKVNREVLSGNLPESFKSYYNGGGVFVGTEKVESKGIDVLATFEDKLAVESGGVKAAVVYCKVGEGAAVLTGPHPEFSGVNLDRDERSHPNYGELIDSLLADDKQRTDFVKACLTKLGLEVSQESHVVPSLSRLHLSSIQSDEISELVQQWREASILVTEDGEEYIKGENDNFHLEKAKRWSLSNLTQEIANILPKSVKDAVVPSTHDAAIPSSSSMSSKSTERTQADQEPDRILDYDRLVKRLFAHDTSLPEPKETPYFNHHAFYSNLDHFQAKHPGLQGDYGRVIMYGEVVTSTNTLLEKNSSWLAHLPIGFTATATTQVAGRGRGSNVWVSPPGSLMFSTVLRHSLSLSNSAPVVFVQYLAAIAIVAGIRSYDRGYDKLPVKLKWPNDIYALNPASDPKQSQYVKIGGILVNSSYSGGDYTLVVGVGMNVSNAAPTTSLSLLAKQVGLPALTIEKLLASILVQFEAIYARFCRTGFDSNLQKQYYDSWLHTGQIVTLEAENGARARITGITSDWGQLVAEELGWQDRPTGKKWELQSDSNSFDFFKGLLKRKM